MLALSLTPLRAGGRDGRPQLGGRKLRGARDRLSIACESLFTVGLLVSIELTSRERIN